MYKLCVYIYIYIFTHVTIILLLLLIIIIKIIIIKMTTIIHIITIMTRLSFPGMQGRGYRLEGRW